MCLCVVCVYVTCVCGGWVGCCVSLIYVAVTGKYY